MSRVAVMLLVAVAASCGPAPTEDGPPAMDAGLSLYRDPGPPLPAGDHFCRRVVEARFWGWLPLATAGTPTLGRGAHAGGVPVFAFGSITRVGEGASAGLLFPRSDTIDRDPRVRADQEVVLFEGVSHRWDVVPDVAAKGSALVAISPFGPPYPVSVVDPVRRQVRAEGRVVGRLAEDELADVSVAARSGGSFVVHGSTLTALDALLQPAAEERALDIWASPQWLVRTDRSVVLVAYDTATALDDRGEIVMAPLATGSVATAAPVWDGARVVYPSAGGVVELDAMGRVAGVTPTFDLLPLTAFGIDDGLVVLGRREAAPEHVRLEVLERGTGRLVRNLRPMGAPPTRYAVSQASTALGPGEAWLLFVIDGTGRVDPVELQCE